MHYLGVRDFSLAIRLLDMLDDGSTLTIVQSQLAFEVNKQNKTLKPLSPLSAERLESIKFIFKPTGYSVVV